MHSNYFQGIMQLRLPTQNIIDYILDNLDKDNQKISKLVELKNGADLYFVDKRYMKSLSVKVQKEFGGLMKESATLHTRDSQTSKELYRLTILIKFTEYRKNDIIEFDNNLYYVLSFAKKLVAYNFAKKKKEKISYPENFKIIPKIKSVIISLEPLQTMDENYQPMETINLFDKKIKQNKQVNTIIHDNIAYII